MQYVILIRLYNYEYNNKNACAFHFNIILIIKTYCKCINKILKVTVQYEAKVSNLLKGDTDLVKAVRKKRPDIKRSKQCNFSARQCP